MDAHRVEVLDRADDDDVVVPVAHDLELELVPAAHRLLDEHLADRAFADPALDLPVKLVLGEREAPAVPAEREGRPDDRRSHQTLDVVEPRDRPRPGHAQTRPLDAVLEELPVFGAIDDVERRSDQLDAQLVEDAGMGKLAGEVERRLAAHRREQRVGPLAAEYRRHAFQIERLEVRAVGEARVGHDRRRIRVHDDRAEPVLAQHLERLAAGVVELARLADHDRAAADQEDRLDVGSTWQARPPNPRSAAMRRAAQGRPRGGTARTGRSRRAARGLRPSRRTARRA